MMFEQKTTLAVEGMTCGSCVRHVRDSLQELEGVISVDVRLSDATVTVRHRPAMAPVGALIRALGVAGYESEQGSAS